MWALQQLQLHLPPQASALQPPVHLTAAALEVAVAVVLAVLVVLWMALPWQFSWLGTACAQTRMR